MNAEQKKAAANRSFVQLGAAPFVGFFGGLPAAAVCFAVGAYRWMPLVFSIMLLSGFFLWCVNSAREEVLKEIENGKR